VLRKGLQRKVAEKGRTMPRTATRDQEGTGRSWEGITSLVSMLSWVTAKKNLVISSSCTLLYLKTALMLSEKGLF